MFTFAIRATFHKHELTFFISNTCVRACSMFVVNTHLICHPVIILYILLNNNRVEVTLLELSPRLYYIVQMETGEARRHNTTHVNILGIYVVSIRFFNFARIFSNNGVVFHWSRIIYWYDFNRITIILLNDSLIDEYKNRNLR